jgi:hypothetical protein
MNVFRTLPLFSIFGLVAVASMGQAPTPTPGPEHERLRELVGNWDFSMSMPEGGGKMAGKVMYEESCGGLWVTSDLKMDLGGVPFQGKGMDGYDPVKKKYISVWVDSMTTYPMIFEGDYDPAKKQLNLVSDALGPDGKPGKWRSVTTLTDRDHHSFEMFLTPQGGTESMVMRVDYTRKK